MTPAGAAPHLEELSLNSVILDEEEDPINSLTQAIECGVLHKLRRLSLDMCFYDYEYMQRMVAAVAELPYLEHLTLADTLDIRVGQGVAKALTMRTVEDTSEAIHPFRSLQSLELSAVMVADFDKMLKALADDKCPMGLPALTKLKVGPLIGCHSKGHSNEQVTMRCVSRRLLKVQRTIWCVGPHALNRMLESPGLGFTGALP